MSSSSEPISETVAQVLQSRASPASARSSILFDNLSVEGAGRGVQGAPTVWTTIKSWANPVRPKTYTKSQPSRTLLHNFSGTLDGGEMLLVIGKPGSGCTTFLKTVANMAQEYKDTTGRLSYGGRPASTKDVDPVRLTFCAEEDNHLATLTVADTLRFAVRSTWNSNTSWKRIETAVEGFAKCFGLSHVLKTKVGSDRVQGCSGGERRRVSLAEALVTCPDVICYDNPTNGLDSSTALEFVEMMHEFTAQHGCSTVMSVYQGSNAMIPHFSKVLVINSGRQIFYGPAEEARPYFENLGFLSSERVTTTDFLNSMTAEPKLRRARPGYENRVPRTPMEFESAFQDSVYRKAIDSAIEEYEKMAVSEAQKRRVFSLPDYLQVLECGKRQFRVLITDYTVWFIEASCTIVQSLFLGTLFRNQTHATRSLFLLSSSLFFTALVPSLQALSEFGNTFAQRDLVIRQKRYRLYRPINYSLGLVLTDMVWKIMAIAYHIPQYFLTGFQRTAAKFFTWFFALYVEHLTMSMIFRAIAVFSPSMAMAALPVGIMFNIFVIYTGFYVPIPEMQVWLSWLRFLDPFYYAYETVMVNEFGDIDYQCSPSDLVPDGPGYSLLASQVCAVPGSEAGQGAVSGAAYVRQQYGFEVSHLWRNVGINLGFFVFFTICTGIGMELYKLPAGRLATIFYRKEPRLVDATLDALTSDEEKAALEGETPPMSHHEAEEPELKNVATQNGRSLLWRDLTLDIKSGSEKKRLLNGVHGFVQPGNLTALMGVSGAGKTTLLNTLAGRMEVGTLSGDVYLDGHVLPKSFRRHMGYVPQQDIHLPTQTVREALNLSAKLRRPDAISINEKEAYVEHVIQILEMQNIADALIGTPGAGLNLEQRKRVTIGVELSAKPDILFLDEPSSGLDGQSAFNIVRLLRKLADSGQTILCTIHQPASEIMERFDHLVLLLRGGKVAYDGPLGEKCSTALNYFGQHGRVCGQRENPAEYFLEVVGAGSRNESRADWTELWLSSSERKQQLSYFENSLSKSSPSKHEPTKQESVTQQSTMEIESEVDKPRADTSRTFATSIAFQFQIIMQRTWIYYWRDPEYFVSKLFMNLSNALLNGLTYLSLSDNLQGMRGRVFSIFVALILGPPLGLQVEGRFFNLREIFLLRERGSQAYHWTVFVITAIIIELPYAFLTGLVYWLLWYYPAGYFTETSRAGYSFLMFQLFFVFCVSVAQLITAVMPNLNATFAANGFFFMFLNTFTGALVPQPITPAGWRWYYKVSPLYYLSEGITSNAISGLQVVCTPEETSIFEPANGLTCGQYAASFLQQATGYLVNPNATQGCEYCPYRDGEAYLTQYNWTYSNHWRDLGIFVGFIAFNFTVVFVLTYLTRIHKWRRR